jgi:hypothetical protein
MTMRWWVAIALLVCMPFRAHAAQLCEDVLVGMQPASNGIAETPIYQQQCRWVAGAVAFNTYTRAFSSAWNYENADDAFAEVRRSCGMDCAAFSFFEDLAWVAISEDDKHYGTSTVSAKEAMRECGSYGHPCELVIGASSTAEAVYWTFGAVAYDELGASPPPRRRDGGRRVLCRGRLLGLRLPGRLWRHRQKQERPAVRGLGRVRSRPAVQREQGSEESMQEGDQRKRLRNRSEGLRAQRVTR